MNHEQSESVQSEQSGAVHLLEQPMWQAIFASVVTISLFGVVLSGIWMMDAIVN